MLVLSGPNEVAPLGAAPRFSDVIGLPDVRMLREVASQGRAVVSYASTRLPHSGMASIHLEP